MPPQFDRVRHNNVLYKFYTYIYVCYGAVFLDSNQEHLQKYHQLLFNTFTTT